MAGSTCFAEMRLDSEEGKSCYWKSTHKYGLKLTFS